MRYFKFKIPTMPDGSRVTYSPGWFGEMTFPPMNSEVSVLLYDDDAGIGIAKTESEKIVACVKRGECELIEEKEALDIVSKADISNEKVFTADRIVHRWDAKPDKIVDTPLVDAPGACAIKPWMKPKKQTMQKFLFWCSECKELSYMMMPAGFKGSGTLKVKCPKGHNVSAPMNQNEPVKKVTDGR